MIDIMRINFTFRLSEWSGARGEICALFFILLW